MLKKGLSVLIASAIFAMAGVDSHFFPIEPAHAQASKAVKKERNANDANLSSRLLFQVIASEIALQRQEAGAAYRTYLSVAEETKDPRLAQRAVEIAIAAKAPREIKQAGALWLKLDPTNVKAQELFIESSINLGEFSQVEATAQHFINTSADPIPFILRLQNFLVLSKDKRRALSFYLNVTDKYSTNPAVQLGIAKLEAVNGRISLAERFARDSYNAKPTPESAVVLSGLLLNNNPKEAKAVLNDYLKRHPDNLKIRDVYVQLLAQQKDFDALLKVADNYKDDAVFSISLAMIFMQCGQRDDARAVLRSFIKRYGFEPKQQQNLSRAYLLLSDISIEEKDYKAALELTSRVKGSLQPTAQIQKANVFVKQNKLEEALSCLNSIDSQQPKVVEEVALFKAKLLEELKGSAAAYEVLKQAMTQIPNSKALNYEAAMVAEEMDNLKLAESHLRAAIKIDPNFANAYNSLGYTLLERTKRVKEAAANINKAYELDPNNPFILDSKGWLAFKQKKYKEAVTYLAEATKKVQEQDIYLHLIEAYWRAGERSEAQAVYMRARSLWPKSAELAALKKKLGLVDEN